MQRFTPETLENRAYMNRASAFNTQLPIAKPGVATPIPEAVRLLPSGNAIVTFYAPSAKQVQIRLQDDVYPLAKSEQGLWSAEVPYTSPGYKHMTYTVDGTDVLNPLAPIGFGYSAPENYIEFPELDCDFYLLKDVPHGVIAQDFYFSTVTGQYESCMLYLPPTYVTQENTRYPVLYLQHGLGENEKCWTYQGKVNFVMDNLLAEGKAAPCIIVMNNGMVHTKAEDSSPQMDLSLLEPLLMTDCIPFIEKKYRVKAGKENRAMAGLSMGSWQTAVTTMNHPDCFEYAGIFSGFLHNPLDEHAKDIHLKALNNPDDFKRRYKLFFRAMGTQDPFMKDFEQDSALMQQKGLTPEQMPAHQIHYYPGGHEWQVWRKCAHDFLQRIFR